MKIRPVGAGQT